MKCLQFRHRSVCNTLSKAQEYNDFVNVIESYENLYNIQQKLNLNCMLEDIQKYNLESHFSNKLRKILDNN